MKKTQEKGQRCLVFGVWWENQRRRRRVGVLRIMSYDTEHYYAVQTFLEDDELCKIWNIIEIAMNRAGYDISNSELSMRLYDDELEDNIEYDMENSLWSLT